MRKILLLLFLVSVSSIAYCQTETKNYPSIQNQIDSLIKKYEIKEIDVLSAHNIAVGPSTDFYLDKGFLIINKTYYFNLDKLVSFNLNKRIFQKKYGISLYFN